MASVSSQAQDFSRHSAISPATLSRASSTHAPPIPESRGQFQLKVSGYTGPLLFSGGAHLSHTYPVITEALGGLMHFSHEAASSVFSPESSSLL